MASKHAGAWASWVIFAALMMIVLGIFDVIGGIAAIFSDDYFAVTKGGLLVENYKVLGALHLVFGVLLASVGYGLMVHLRPWARTAAIVIAMGDAAVHMAFLNAQPIRSLISIMIAVLVVYALTVRWEDVKHAD
jgi:hypothetical protein